MKRAFIGITAIFLSLSGTSAEEGDEPRTDGKINIGGVLYSEEEMKDPEKRRKTEQAIKRIQQMKELGKKPRDYSDISTQELFEIVLTHTGNLRFREDLNELSKRPAQTKAAIEDFLRNEKPFSDNLLLFSRLPSVAKVLGTEYHVEVVKKILNHPLAKKYDEDLIYDRSSSMPGGGLLDHLASSSKDETQTLDKLIAEGRIGRGSEMELKWRKLLSVGNRKEKNRAGKNDPQDARTDDRETGKIPMGKADSESSPDSSYLVLGGVIVLLGILALLFKVWKGKSAR